MMLKAIAVVAFIALCHAQEHKGHAYSSQSIVLHHTEHKGHHEPEHHEHHDQHESHQPQHHVEVVVPVVAKKVLPVVQYVVESSGHEHGHQYEHHEHQQVEHGHQSEQLGHQSEQYGPQSEHHDHKPAFSSQHIERHDIPAHPPKGFFDEHGPAKYEFQYNVHDPHTHDVKEQHEARDGHKVHGVYSLHEADGSIRTVHYTADKKTGFQADVQHTTKHVEESKHHH